MVNESKERRRLGEERTKNEKKVGNKDESGREGAGEQQGRKIPYCMTSAAATSIGVPSLSRRVVVVVVSAGCTSSPLCAAEAKNADQPILISPVASVIPSHLESREKKETHEIAFMNGGRAYTGTNACMKMALGPNTTHWSLTVPHRRSSIRSLIPCSPRLCWCGETDHGRPSNRPPHR